MDVLNKMDCFLMHHSIFAFKKSPDDTRLDFFEICFLFYQICAIDTAQDILNQYISVCYLLFTL